MLEPLKIIDHFYPADTPLKRLLLAHSFSVRDKALAIAAEARRRDLPLDLETVENGALLHDVGIFKCHAPGIFCTGKEPYIAHGVIGAKLLRNYGSRIGADLEACARICERHTGSGISAAEVAAQHLPLPPRDYLPETLEEKLVCLADKFFSKSGDRREKPLERIRGSLAKFGEPALARFDALCELFHIH